MLGGFGISGVQLSTDGALTALKVAFGSTIEIVLNGLISNPGNTGSYSLQCITSACYECSVENFQVSLDFPTLPSPELNFNKISLGIYPN